MLLISLTAAQHSTIHPPIHFFRAAPLRHTQYLQLERDAGMYECRKGCGGVMLLQILAASTLEPEERRGLQEVIFSGWMHELVSG